ncbi:MAG: hypothetical protein NTV30_08250 [Chloroflexi bacterium]|nr:hypothetical protein [Chloroflexota bacterium]
MTTINTTSIHPAVKLQEICCSKCHRLMVVINSQEAGVPNEMACPFCANMMKLDIAEYHI